MKEHYWGGRQSQRGTINPKEEELVHIRYKEGGYAWVSPTVAQMAITRGQAEKTPVSKTSLKK